MEIPLSPPPGLRQPQSSNQEDLILALGTGIDSPHWTQTPQPSKLSEARGTGGIGGIGGMHMTSRPVPPPGLRHDAHKHSVCDVAWPLSFIFFAFFFFFLFFFLQ
jgi:hypothetical protein